ncbi:type 1 glutamine amidotransferase domain-containing protein [Aquimarina sp. Aq107]|uniref:type 1 glutamine amidotransferase domain-containing protein n=1 Tax=Aquimarina sp. Aq107 TaxID=1191912 RepID=UPI000D561C11|nr:type 1 glutamine amidotransferase domain-containing protein [Aquimarina sp. Aq107]
MKSDNIKTIALVLLLLITTSISAQNKKMLFIMSAADSLSLNEGKKLRQTGVFLNEFYFSYKAAINRGYQVDFATPAGMIATIDEESMKDKYWKEQQSTQEEAISFVKENHFFNHPLSLKEAFEQKEQYAGLIIPGGQGLMVDLFYNPLIPMFLKTFQQDQKVIGLICHAPSLLLTIPEHENPFIGYEVNSVSPFEEFYIETFIMKGKPKNRKIAKRLKRLGLKYRSKGPKADFAIAHKNLVTSQNPFSSDSFNKLYFDTLSKKSNSEVSK